MFYCRFLSKFYKKIVKKSFKIERKRDADAEKKPQYLI